MKKGKFNLLTPENAWRVLGVFIVLTLIFSAIAGLTITRGNKVIIKNITLDVRGAALNFEQYEPRNVDSEGHTARTAFLPSSCSTADQRAWQPATWSPGNLQSAASSY